MSVVISVENVSKQYRLGEVGTGTLSHDVNRWWHKVRGKEDPYLKVGESNDRLKKGESEYSWALRDISFEVKQGDVLGIIGRNGAGKSTLLKILSRVTTPTTGEIKVKGRIASLLEVGTGFHPELTGRENIYINGAILGMRKYEITSKLDEIIEFSGCERYIDTPVKRYSSGMYVRLAFAVAAHLEPEILIIDEVLAVGDAEFQKKCLGKMKDVAGQGRTVLFVSHNMAAIQTLCTVGLYLESGKSVAFGQLDKVVDQYIRPEIGQGSSLSKKRTVVAPLECDFVDAQIETAGTPTTTLEWDEPFSITLKVIAHNTITVSLELLIRDQNGIPILFAPCGLYMGSVHTLEKGAHIIHAECKGLRLASGQYSIDLALAESGKKFYVYYESALALEVADKANGETKWHFTQRHNQGCIPLDVQTTATPT
jgi:lipopolysaccharide transport system ATP-binding protein